MNKIVTVLAFVMASGLAQTASAACTVVKGGAKSPFDGKSLSGLEIEKKSLIKLNNEFKGLDAMTKSFKGEVNTCTTCTDNYVTCD